VLRSRR